MNLDATETNLGIFALVLLLLCLASLVERWQGRRTQRRLKAEADRQRRYWAEHPPANVLPWTGGKR